MKFRCEWIAHLYFINEVYAAKIREIFKALIENIVFVLFNIDLLYEKF